MDKEFVEYLAKLAQLKLTDTEKEQLPDQLKKILEYVSMLSQVDIEGVEPTAYLQTSEAWVREDEPKASLSLDLALSNAPELDGPFFKVPGVL